MSAHFIEILNLLLNGLAQKWNILAFNQNTHIKSKYGEELVYTVPPTWKSFKEIWMVRYIQASSKMNSIKVLKDYSDERNGY